MLPLQEGLKPGILPTLYRPSQLSPSRTSPRLQLTPFSLYETQFKQLTAHTSTTHVTCPPRCFDFKKSSNFSLLHRWQSALANSVHWPNHCSQPRQPYLSSPSTSLCPWHSPQFAFSMEVMFEFLRTYDFTPVPASPYAVDSTPVISLARPHHTSTFWILLMSSDFFTATTVVQWTPLTTLTFLSKSADQNIS